MVKVSLQTEKKHRKRSRKSTVEVVKAVVKRQLAAKVEHKKLNVSPLPITLVADAMAWINLSQLIAVGTGQQNRIGTKITNCRLHMNFVLYPIGIQGITDIDRWQAINFTCSVIKCNQQVGVGSFNWTSSLLGTTFPFLLDQDNMPTSRSNRHDYTYVKRKSIVSRAKNYPIVAGLPTRYGPQTSINLSAKLGTLQWEEFNAAWLKGDQYYLICHAHALGAIGPDLMGAIQTTGTLTWDDA